MPPFKLADLKKIAQNPDPADALWLSKAEESIQFLQQSASAEEIVLYTSARYVLIHGVLGLTRKLTQQNINELQHRDIPQSDDAWVIQKEWSSRGHRMYLEPPLESVSETLVGGEKLIFRREFTGVDQERAPIEISQKLVHSLGLYFVPERNSYCRLNHHGDIEDVIRIFQQAEDKPGGRLDAVTILRADLDKFMALSKQSLVIRFDFTRFAEGSFSGWGALDRSEVSVDDLYYHSGSSAAGSYCNGVLVVRSKVTVAKLIQQWKAEEDRSSRQYAIFKIYDRKNSKEVETSCAPTSLSNYFQDSQLPWEISPAFFRAEVLHRFKADPEKYSLDDRSISCRGAWSLRSYDLNDEGQVHAYIGDLAKLPYEEQVYWQSFNVWPKGSISKRAHQTDIVGSWHFDYEPVGAIKQIIADLDKSPPAWWNSRGELLAAAVHHPATDSVKEWADEILALDQFLVEGFLIKPLRIIAEGLGRPIQSSWASLRVLQEILCGCGHSETAAKSIITPLQRLHGLRTEVRGHATVAKKRAAELQARTDHSTLRGHFSALAAECERSLSTIIECLGQSS